MSSYIVKVPSCSLSLSQIGAGVAGGAGLLAAGYAAYQHREGQKGQQVCLN